MVGPKIPHSIMPILGTSQLKRIDQAIEGLQLNLDDQSWFDIYTAIIGPRYSVNLFTFKS